MNVYTINNVILVLIQMTCRILFSNLCFSFTLSCLDLISVMEEGLQGFISSLFSHLVLIEHNYI